MRRSAAAWGRAGWGRSEPPAADDTAAWLAGALPADWFDSAPELTIDRDEILIVGQLSEPTLPGDATDADRAAAQEGRASAFRESTREQRIRIAEQLEQRYQRKVAWGVSVGGNRQLFTTYSVPVMTRLRQSQREVLDTLVEAGVARSRSEALAWCVSLVGRNTDEWLAQLRDAMGTVAQVRRSGPTAD
jgi:hypothetical protein